MDRVPELRFLKQEAERLGIRVYLFGGTAAGYAHYVRWDLMRERGDRRFQAERFDYDFTNIYRSNQDLDIVVDGSKDKISELEARLRQAYPHLQGDKEAWEVRSLRENLSPTKMALLNNPDFRNQNTDSMSTGLIEVTRSGESVVRDLFHWENRNSQFLRDLVEGKITYYDSPQHESTQRAREGQNPKVMSVVRYFIKAGQFELQMRGEDMGRIREIIAQFDPRRVQRGYVERKLNTDLIPKLVQNVVNLEYTFDLLTQIGLRQKLINLSDARNVESGAWWLNKEPLRSFDVGRGSGRTAQELGLTVVAHETSSLRAWESITRSHTGAPNVFISRQNAVGEAALHGDGFYTRRGTTGARGTGITIRFQLHPQAREGTDFIVAASGDYIVVRNKNALRVIQERINLSLSEIIDMVSLISPQEKALMERLKRRLGNNFNSLRNEEIREVRAKLSEILVSPDAAKAYTAFEFILEPLSNGKNLLGVLYDPKDSQNVRTVVELLSYYYRNFSSDRDTAKEFKQFFSKVDAEVLARAVPPNQRQQMIAEIVTQLSAVTSYDTGGEFAELGLYKSKRMSLEVLNRVIEWSSDLRIQELLPKLVQTQNVRQLIEILSLNVWRPSSQVEQSLKYIVDELSINNKHRRTISLFYELLMNSEVFERYNLKNRIAGILLNPHSQFSISDILHPLANNPKLLKDPLALDWLTIVLRNAIARTQNSRAGQFEGAGSISIFFEKFAGKISPEFLSNQFNIVLRSVPHTYFDFRWFNGPWAVNYAEEFIQLIRKNNTNSAYAYMTHLSVVEVLSSSFWNQKQEVLESFIRQVSMHRNYESLPTDPKIEYYINEYLLKLPQWRHHPELLRLTQGAPPTYELLLQKFNEGFTFIRNSCGGVFL